jgi:hypothetical protein
MVIKSIRSTTKKYSILKQARNYFKSNLHCLLYLVEKNILEPIVLKEIVKYRVAGLDLRLSTMDEDGGQLTNNRSVIICDGHVFENRFQYFIFKLIGFSKRCRAHLDISTDDQMN